MNEAPLVSDQLEFRRPSPELLEPLVTFFAALQSCGDDRFFHPHPFTPAAAAERCHYAGKDVYCLVVVGTRVVGYGMLRGWDEGYDIPSLGIAMHPHARGFGLGRLLMLYLHAEAQRRGATKVRLKVYPGNAVAVTLYRSLGYEFDHVEHGELVGFKTLGE